MGKKIILLFKISVIAGIFFYLFYSNKLTPGQLEEVFRMRNAVYFAISGATFFGAQMLGAVRLRMLLKTVDISITIRKCFALTMVGNLFNMVVPGMTGGDIAKGFYLLKAEDAYKGKSSGVMIMDRVIGSLALLFLSVFF